jgi:hypothetical protein
MDAQMVGGQRRVSLVEDTAERIAEDWVNLDLDLGIGMNFNIE